MKFSYRQILASAAGAVLSAVIASIFGVKGTVVGVAIGSVAATTGTALALQSIERTNKAVKNVAVRVPNRAKLLRRLGGTEAAGVTETTPGGSSSLAEETATSAASNNRTVETNGEGRASAPSADATDETMPRRTIRWPIVAGAVVGVFVFALALVTVVELIVGRPLADIFGHSGGGTTVQRIFETPSTTLPPPTTTTTTTTTTSSTSTTTSTTNPTSSTTTTTTSLGATTTSTTGLGSSSSSTTTTVPDASASNTATQSG